MWHHGLTLYNSFKSFLRYVFQDKLLARLEEHEGDHRHHHHVDTTEEDVSLLLIYVLHHLVFLIDPSSFLLTRQ
jgi:hypothetical protein